MMLGIVKIKNILLRRWTLNYKVLKFLKYKYTVYYNKRNNSELSILCSNFGTNKGYIFDKNVKRIDTKFCQDYSDFYSDLFLFSKNSVKKVFELGIGTVDKKKMYNMSFVGENYQPGGSLRVWKNFFKNANIYGADIDKNILFQEERIKTFYVDQGNIDSIKLLWQNISENDFDIIIDDGCHRYEETVTFFENSIERLRDGGVYIIEDILPSQRIKFLKYFNSTKLNYKFINFYRPYKNPDNNSLVLIQK
jgi:hypothetical protein